MLACLLLLCACAEQKPAETTVPTTTAAPTTEPTTVPTTVPTEPPMDAQTLLSLAQQAREANSWTSLKDSTVCSMTLNMPTLGMSMDMAIKQEGSMLYDPVQDRGYQERTSTMEGYGQVQTSTSQMYTRTEDGVPVRYTYEVDSNLWTKETLEEEDNDSAKLLNSLLADTLVLEEETQLLEEMEVYVLRGELGEAFTQELSDGFMKGMGQTESTGRDNNKDAQIACHAVLYIEKETNLVRSYSVDMEGLDVLIENFFSQQFSGQMGMGMVITVEVEIDTMRHEVTQMAYDPVEVPEISAKGIAAANQTSFEPAQEDGSYIIQESGDAVRIQILSGWDVESAEYDNLTLTRDDDHYCYYTMYNDDYTLPENVQYWVDYYYEEYQVTMESGTGEPVNGYETMWYRGGGVYSWCMQIPVGECYLFIEATSFSNNNTYSYLEHFAANCTPYDLTAETTA